MEVDHIFIFSENKGVEADELTSFGLAEGSGRIHPGQGTANRKFYFDNFFLEIIWVIDENEIRNPPTSETGLWKRSKFSVNENSRFGLCLANSKETDGLFKESRIYQPNYFPTGMAIDIIPNEQLPQLPWTFRLPFRGEKRSANEPRIHSNNIRKLTGVEFGVPDISTAGYFVSSFEQEESIVFKESSEVNLVLEFDQFRQNTICDFKELDLIIKY